MSSSVDIQIPQGDVAELDQAARWHAQLATELEEHQQTLMGSSFKLATQWEGVAAEAYSEYSQHVVARYGAAADQAREISRVIAGWSKELAADQKRSKVLLSEAEAKAKAIAVARKQLAADQQAHASNQARLSRAHAAVATAVDPAAAANEVSAAASAVSTSQAAIASDEKTLKTLTEDLEILEHQATKIYESAEEMAQKHNAYLSHIHITPPGLLSMPTASTPALASVAPVLAAPVATAVSGGGEGEDPGTDPATAANVGAGPATILPANLAPVASGARQGAITFGDLEKLGKRYGWSAAQDRAWWEVIKLESGGNPAATNPGSGAYGIGQFLGSTMKEYAPYGAASPNPMDQLNAMAKYINDRYGTPAGALSFHLAHNWY